MQNCPLKTAQIASVMALNAQIRNIYGTMPRTPPLLPCTPSCKIAYPGDGCFCHQLNHYPQNGHTAKSAWIKACIPLHILTC